MKRIIALAAALAFVFASGVLADDAGKGIPQRPLDNPKYVEAKKQPHWCGTMERWETRGRGPDFYREAVGCPTEGPCDDPAVRDTTSSDLMKVRLLFHAMHRSDGSGGVSQATVDATLNQMNTDYAPYNIEFVSTGTRHHNDDEHYCIAGYGLGDWQGDIAAMKAAYAEAPDSQCNIFISCQNWSPIGYLLGVGTFPWDPDALTKQGGIWLNNVAVGADAHTATHEMGHNLGNWHTHHGVSEGGVQCGDPCYEYASGFEGDIRGDFCADTPPTPVNYYCQPPGGEDCEGTPWGTTLYEDYMGYGEDYCLDTFTVSQMLRMHCWTYDVLGGWLETTCNVIAQFTADQTVGCVPLTVNFTDQSTGPVVSWSWDFGDGNTSIVQHPSHEYTAAGTYIVSLTVSSTECSDTETKTDYITVNVAPTADFSGSPTSGCAPLTVNLTDLSTGDPTSWSWDFGDGGTSPEQNPTHEYASAGDYTVTLTATNACGSDIATKVNYIHVDPPCGVKAFALSDIPVKGTVSGDYTDTHDSDDVYEVITETESGGKPANRYSYLEHKWDFNVTAGTSITFYVEAYRPNNSDGDDFAFEYSTDNSSFASLVTVNSAVEQTYSAPMPGSVSGTVYIRVVDTDRTPGKRSLDAIYVDYMYIESSSEPGPPIADFSGSPTSGPAPLTVNFTDLSSGAPTSWSWDFGDGGTSNVQNPSHEYTAAGTYTVSLTASNAYGSDTETKVDYITATGPCTMHVHDITVGRKEAGPNCNGLCTVWIYDQNEQPLSDATVYVSATGPVSGSYSGVTSADGSVSFETGKTKDCAGEWCFEVTNVTHSSCTYDPVANHVTKACESGWVYRDGASSAILIPSESGLGQNYPNPFNASTMISFSLTEASQVKLEVYNVLGEKVTTLVDGWREAGSHSAVFEASSLASGIYFYRLQVGDLVETRKMILMK